MQPQKYERTTDFTERDGDDTDHASINAEFDAAALTTDQIRENLALIQRDDGALKNGIVTADALDDTAFDAVLINVNVAVNDAQTSAASALTSATTALAARDVTLAAKSTTETARDVTILNANNASASALAALNSQTAAAASQSDAAASKVASASSQVAAAASATSASTSATTATTQAGIATSKAADSLASATASASSAAGAQSAKVAAETARDGAQTARAGSEAARDTSVAAKDAAAVSQSAASSSASSAGTSATTATTKAAEAVTSANSAAASATTSTAQAVISTTKATESAASAAAALASKNAAATSETNAAASQVSAASSAAAAASSYDSFDDRYLGPKASAPTLDNDGNALLIGALYFNTTTNAMQVYGSSGWTAAGSSVNGTSRRFEYVATAGQTTFTGADAAGNTLAYDAGYVDVYLNGARLKSNDYTASSGTSIVLAVAAALNDELNIVAFGTFNVATHVAKTGDVVTGPLVADTGYKQGLRALRNYDVAVSPAGAAIQFGAKLGTTPVYPVDITGVTDQNGTAYSLEVGFDGTTVLSVNKAKQLSLPFGQIKFPATQNASADANTLDDYEEGEWTPTARSGGSVSNISGAFYTKIGRCVTVNFYYSFTPTNNGSGFEIGGLPFPTANALYMGGSIGYSGALNTSNWGFLVPPNSSYCYFHSLSGGAQIANNAFAGASNPLICTITYFTT